MSSVVFFVLFFFSRLLSSPIAIWRWKTNAEARTWHVKFGFSYIWLSLSRFGLLLCFSSYRHTYQIVLWFLVGKVGIYVWFRFWFWNATEKEFSAPLQILSVSSCYIRVCNLRQTMCSKSIILHLTDENSFTITLHAAGRCVSDFDGRCNFRLHVRAPSLLKQMGANGRPFYCWNTKNWFLTKQKPEDIRTIFRKWRKIIISVGSSVSTWALSIESTRQQ